jgi:Na+/H+ antiporter NhaB
MKLFIQIRHLFIACLLPHRTVPPRGQRTHQSIVKRHVQHMMLMQKYTYFSNTLSLQKAIKVIIILASYLHFITKHNKNVHFEQDQITSMFQLQNFFLVINIIFEEDLFCPCLMRSSRSS